MASGRTNASGTKTLPGTASPSDVRLGKTFSRDGKTIASGSLNLNNLVPRNIRKGVNIGGVHGSIDLTNLDPQNVKNGVSINGVTGNYDGELVIFPIPRNSSTENGYYFRESTWRFGNKRRIKVYARGTVKCSVDGDNYGNYKIFKNNKKIKEGSLSGNSSHHGTFDLEVNVGDELYIEGGADLSIMFRLKRKLFELY